MITTRGWLIAAVLGVLLLDVSGIVVASGSSSAPDVRSRDVLIDVVDGPARDQPVRIDATYSVPAITPAPAVLLPPGFGSTKASLADDAAALARRGFAVLAYSARGFGRTTGQIALNSPDYEVADAEQLVDWLSRQPEVLLDKPGDPRVGVSGASYGGALALMLAGVDHRVDAIASVITYNDLSTALLPNSAASGSPPADTPAAGALGRAGVFKKAWAGALFGSALTGPAGSAAACGRFRPEVCNAYTEVATTGAASQGTLNLLRRDSPVSVASTITAPTLLVQGEQDTLFGLDQADATARQIAGTVRVDWYPGGHDGAMPGDEVRNRVGDWFAFHLAHTGTDPGAGFSYDVPGAIRARGAPALRTVSASAYPGRAGGHTERRSVRLAGPAQRIVNPAGGTPASLSVLPGLGTATQDGSGAAIAGGLATDIPGESAVFTSEPMDSPLLVAGSALARITVDTVPADTARDSAGGAVLFAKLYDVGPDGRRTLPGSAVAPIRLERLPAEVTVTLAGIVRPVASGHRLHLVVTTTDQAYANQTAPATLRVALAGDRALSVPVVPGTSVSGDGLPLVPLVGIGVVLVLAAVTALVATVRRRHADDVDPELVDVPIVLTALTKSYPGRLTAVRELSLRVDKGQVLGLLGPNGAGKTTTLRMLMGLVRPTSGEIRLFGHRVRPGAPVLSRIGSFVEGAGFLPHLSGAANLRLYWAATGRPPGDAHVEQALEVAGLGDAIRRRVGTYSQGMRQRLAIAQAMLGLPDLLVLDEPTNGLDPSQIHQMRDVLRRYAATGRTVVVSSHLLSEVEQACTHVVVMHRGQLVAAGEIDEIGTRADEAAFLVDQPAEAADVLRRLNGTASVSTRGQVVHAELGAIPRSAAVAALVRAGVAVEQAGPRHRLEDAFLRLVGGDQ